MNHDSGICSSMVEQHLSMCIFQFDSGHTPINSKGVKMIAACPYCNNILTNRIIGSSKHYKVEKYCRKCGYKKDLIESDGENMNVIVEVFNNGSKTRSKHFI